MSKLHGQAAVDLNNVAEKANYSTLRVYKKLKVDQNKDTEALGQRRYLFSMNGVSIRVSKDNHGYAEYIMRTRCLICIYTNVAIVFGQIYSRMLS